MQKNHRNSFGKAAALIIAVIMLFSASTAASAASKTVTAKSSVSVLKAAKVNLSKCTVKVASSVAYTGKALKPAVTVKNGKKTLKNGKDYTVTYSSNTAIGTGKVTVKAKGSAYTGSKTATFNIVPGKASLSAKTTTSSVELTWKKVPGATKYVVYSYNTSNKKYTSLATVTATKYTVNKLTAGKTYSYAVKAVAVKNSKTYNGAYSAVKTVATCPAKVGSVTATSGDKSLKITWKAVSGASGYNVYTYDAAKKTYTLKTTVASTSATIKSLKAATEYSVCVCAYRTAGGVKYNGAKSAIVKQTTKPAKVTGVKITKNAEKSLDVTWTKVSGAKGYKVYTYNISQKKYTLRTTVSGNTATISGLSSGTTYAVSVCAYSTYNKVNISGTMSDYVLSPTAPAKVAKVTASPESVTVNLKWDKVTGATGYRVYSYVVSTKKYVKLFDVKTNSASVENLEANTSYSYAVAALRTDNKVTAVGAKSPIVTTMTQKTNHFNKFYNMFRKGTFSLTMKMKDESMGELTSTLYIKGESVKLVATYMGIDMIMQRKGNEKFGYMYAPDLRIYQKLTEAQCKESELVAADWIDIFAPEKASNIDVVESTQKVDGKNCTTYTYKTVYGNMVTYYVYGDSLVRIRNSGEVFDVSNVSSSVSDSVFNLPKLFPVGYVKFDMF